jgi:hypothetical protein
MTSALETWAIAAVWFSEPLVYGLSITVGLVLWSGAIGTISGSSNSHVRRRIQRFQLIFIYLAFSSTSNTIPNANTWQTRGNVGHAKSM